MAPRAKKSSKPSKPVPQTDSKPTVVSGAIRRAQREAMLDSFRNAVTNVGTVKDKTTYGEYERNPLLDMWTIETLLQDHDIARKIAYKPVEDALRAGFSLKRPDSSPEKDKADARKLTRAWRKLVQSPKDEDLFARGARLGRAFGGGGLILGVRGAGSLSSPLDDERVRKIEFLIDFDRQDMTPATYYPDGTVEKYRYTSPESGDVAQKGALVHESRVMVFPAAMTTNRTRQLNSKWNCSVLQSCYDVLESFDGMFSSVDQMFADVSQAVFKLQGLIEALAEADGEAAQDVQTRLQLLNLYRSSANAIMLDAGGEAGDGAEGFEVVERDLAGLDGPMQQYLVRLACAAEMPLTVLLGMAPAGMDATGESDLILYFNTVDVYRQKLTVHLERLIHMLAREVLGEEDPQWEIVWPELQRPKPLDVTTASKMKVDTAVALITAQAILPEEVALSLQNMVPDLGLIVDTASREKALKVALKEVEEREMTGPNAQPEPEEVDAGAGVSQPTKSSERKTPSKAAGKQV
jgi:phage-related protein (TIGR01555 family)